MMVKDRFNGINFRDVFRVEKINDYTIHIKMVDNRTLTIREDAPADTDRTLQELIKRKKEALSSGK